MSALLTEAKDVLLSGILLLTQRRFGKILRHPGYRYDAVFGLCMVIIGSSTNSANAKGSGLSFVAISPDAKVRVFEQSQRGGLLLQTDASKRMSAIPDAVISPYLTEPWLARNELLAVDKVNGRLIVVNTTGPRPRRVKELGFLRIGHGRSAGTYTLAGPYPRIAPGGDMVACGGGYVSRAQKRVVRLIIYWRGLRRHRVLVAKYLALGSEAAAMSWLDADRLLVVQRGSGPTSRRRQTAEVVDFRHGVPVRHSVKMPLPGQIYELSPLQPSTRSFMAIVSVNGISRLYSMDLKKHQMTLISVLGGHPLYSIDLYGGWHLIQARRRRLLLWNRTQSQFLDLRRLIWPPGRVQSIQVGRVAVLPQVDGSGRLWGWDGRRIFVWERL